MSGRGRVEWRPDCAVRKSIEGEEIKKKRGGGGEKGRVVKWNWAAETLPGRASRTAQVSRGEAWLRLGGAHLSSLFGCGGEAKGESLRG